jgi:protein-tyrosine phosphatase
MGIGVILRFTFVSVLFGTLARQLRLRGNVVPANVLSYGCGVHLVLAVLVHLQKHAWIIGKSAKDGSLPVWSQVVWWPFHATNRVFARLAKNRKGVAAATEVFPHFWVGGWHAFELDVEWEAVVDLTCELPRRCPAAHYLNLPTWDGVVRVEDVALAAEFIARHAKNGHVLIHCAHGVGRSSTVARAGLVASGHFNDVGAALERIREHRPVCKTSPHFEHVLAKWTQQTQTKKCKET